MSERPFMQLYVSDFVGDTLALSAELVGAYLLILMSMWNAKGELPDDAATLARIARIRIEDWPAAWARLSSYFEVADGKVTQERLARELAKFARKSAARSDAGKRGAAAKALKSHKPTQAIAQQMHKHSPETRIKKRATLSDPTDGLVKLDRNRDEHLFKACEELTGEKVPPYMQFKSWPREIVAAASRGTTH